MCQSIRQDMGITAVQVLVNNRQRIIKVNLAQIRAMTGILSDALCENLLTQPTKGFSARLIKQLQQRSSISLVLLSNKSIQKLNNKWRGKNYATDVLSFPLNLKEPSPGIPWELGEIFISVEKAIEQATSFNHSLNRELAFLFVHGFLHILGFDHENVKDEQIMRRRQKAILTSAGYSR